MIFNDSEQYISFYSYNTWLSSINHSSCPTYTNKNVKPHSSKIKFNNFINILMIDFVATETLNVYLKRTAL